MNTKSILAIAAFAAVASTGVHADEADGSQYGIKFQSNRARAEVQAEAATVAATRSTEPNGSRVAPAVKSTVETATLRAQTAQAVRQGLIAHGEM